MPELPGAMQARFQADYGLSAYDAATLTAASEMADYFEAAASAAGAANAKPAPTGSWANSPRASTRKNWTSPQRRSAPRSWPA
jgi:Asp-tRNA(Asn)/Glu-tRNA(Gln) amidotransferase B subunit